MEHFEKDTAAEPKISKELELVTEPEGCNRSQSPALYVSTNSHLPESSTYSSLVTVEGGSSNRYVMSLANPNSPSTTPCCATDAGNVVKESVKDFKIPKLASVSTSKNTEGLNRRQKGLWQNFYQLAGGSRSRNPSGASVCHENGRMLLNSKEKERSSFGCEELKPFSAKQMKKGLDGVSTCLADGYQQFNSSNPQPGGDDGSKIVSSSSFKNFFLKQSHKDKAAESTDPEAHNEHHSAAMAQCENRPAPASAMNSDALLVRKASTPSHHINWVGPLLSHGKISLREWLKSGASEVKKVDRLNLFRQVVQLVDVAHYEGIGLLDLRPSKFIFASPNSIKYTGSSTPVGLASIVIQARTKKRPLELDMHEKSQLAVKQQTLGKDMESTRYQSRFISAYGTISEAIGPTSLLEADVLQLEKKWYACPEELDGRGLLSSNIYSLGVFLFELLCHFESTEVHYAAMLDLRDRILPAKFLSENPKEAGFCFWLLHPEPSSRPTTREILQSESIYSSEDVVGDDISSQIEKEEDVESELLLHFLGSLKEQKQNHISSLLERIECLETDIKEVGRRHEPVLNSDWVEKGFPTSRWDLVSNDCDNTEVLLRTFLTRNMVEQNLNLMKNISQLENTYFSLKSRAKSTEMSSMERSDKALLSTRDKWCEAQTVNRDPNMEGKLVDGAGSFFEGICKFARYSKFEVCGTKWNGDLLNSTNVICSLSCDRYEDYIAAAGVTKKIKVFEFGSLLNDSADIQYPMVEMSNESKFSCVCWNQYIQNYLASTDYDGVVQMWDASTGQPFAQYIEHQKRAWSVDFSRVDPTKFSSGSDDCSVKLWSITDRNSTGTIRNPANVCCVQFSDYSSHLLAFGSADYKIYCYDLRHTRIPWCALTGHGKAVSYVKFIDSETLVSASTDNTLKLWDLKNTSMDGLISNACSLTFSGHTNEKNFVGLSVLDGYIACGSETNEVFAYQRSLPMPITSHKFGSLDPISGHEIDDSNGQFVSSVCWRRKSNMVVAANSSGSIKLLRMV